MRKYFFLCFKIMAVNFLLFSILISKADIIQRNDDIKVRLSVNDDYVWEKTIPSLSGEAIITNDDFSVKRTLNVGDKLTVEVTFLNSNNCNGKNVNIEGLADVFKAFFGGEFQHYVDPSVRIGGVRPFIPYETKVHKLVLRPYPEGFEPLYNKMDGFINRSGSTNQNNCVFQYSWYFKVKRKKDLVPIDNSNHTFSKYRILKDGSKQRFNQKEGLNIEFLSFWWNDPTKVDEKAKYQRLPNNHVRYMMGFDDDELMYFHNTSKTHNTYLPGFNGTIAKLERITSRGMPEGDTEIFDKTTGLSISGSPINYVLTAYLKNKAYNTYAKDDPQFIYYDQQFNYFQGIRMTEKSKADLSHYSWDLNQQNVIFTGNTPIKIIVEDKNTATKYTYKLRLTVDAPEVIINEDPKKSSYPSTNFKETVTVRIMAHDWLPNTQYSKKGKLVLEHSYFDEVGKMSVTDYDIGELTPKVEIFKEIPLESSRNGVSGLTVYYVPIILKYKAGSPNYDYEKRENWIVIGGSEYKTLYLGFFGKYEFDGGAGLANKVWINDNRQEKYGEYSSLKNYGGQIKYTKPHTREYVVELSSTKTVDTSFYFIKDGDPHLVNLDDVGEEEWFLSDRAQKKRLPLTTLFSRLTYYYLKTKEPIKDRKELFDTSNPNVTVEQGKSEGKNHSGKKFAHFKVFTLQDTGYYIYETAVYKGNTGPITAITHRTKVNYAYNKNVRLLLKNDAGNTDEVFQLSNPKATPRLRALNDQEKEFLNVYSNKDTVYRILEVTEVKSSYKKTGPKFNDPPNRWAESNDFKEKYTWNLYEHLDDKVRKGDVAVHKTKLQIEDTIKEHEFLANYKKNYLNYWLWDNIAIHYSSNWRSQKVKNQNGVLEDGLPNYVKSSLVGRIYKDKDLDDKFSTELDLLFAHEQPSPWQYVVPLTSYTDGQGYRMRYNPSCIYSIDQMFDPKQGAFSGKPKLPESYMYTLAPDISDKYKDAQELYYNLYNGNIILVSFLRKSDPIDIFGVVFNDIGGVNDTVGWIKTKINPTIADFATPYTIPATKNYYVLNDQNYCLSVTNLNQKSKSVAISWKNYTDNKGNVNYGICSAVKISRRDAKTEDYLHNFYIDGIGYVDISYKNRAEGEVSKNKVIMNSPLILSNSSVNLKLYKYGNQPQSNSAINIALEKDNWNSSFSYKIVEVLATQIVTPPTVPLVTSSSPTSALKAIKVTNGVGTGVGTVAGVGGTVGTVVFFKYTKPGKYIFSAVKNKIDRFFRGGNRGGQPVNRGNEFELSDRSKLLNDDGSPNNQTTVDDDQTTVDDDQTVANDDDSVTDIEDMDQTVDDSVINNAREVDACSDEDITTLDANTSSVFGSN